MRVYSYRQIGDITEKGIFLKDGYCVDFSVCILNSRRHFGSETTACVGVRDYAAVPPYFIFFAEVEVKIEFDLHKGLFAKKKNGRDFQNFQNILRNMNVTTYDLS